MPIAEIPEDDLDLVMTIGEVLEAYSLAFLLHNGGSALIAIGISTHAVGTAVNAEVRARYRADPSKASAAEFIDLYLTAAKDQAHAVGILPEFETILDHFSTHRAWPPVTPGMI